MLRPVPSSVPALSLPLQHSNDASIDRTHFMFYAPFIGSSNVEGDQLTPPVIWRFTVIWTLILIGGIFFLCSMMAFITTLLSLTTLRSDPPDPADKSNAGRPLGGRRKRKRPPLWPVFLIPLVGSGIGAVLAFLSGTVVGFVLAAVYSAGGFSMST